MDGAPYASYRFIFHIGKAAAAGSGGGMEHANSTAIYVPSGEYLAQRLRPRIFPPVEREAHPSRRPRTDRLHPRNVHARVLVRRRCHQHLRFLHSGAHRNLEQAGILCRTLARRSPNSNRAPRNNGKAPNNPASMPGSKNTLSITSRSDSVSYYTKGQVLGVLLDILIRDRTDNQHSLDDVLRAMNTDFASAGKFYRDSWTSVWKLKRSPVDRLPDSSTITSPAQSRCPTPNCSPARGLIFVRMKAYAQRSGFSRSASPGRRGASLRWTRMVLPPATVCRWETRF